MLARSPEPPRSTEATVIAPDHGATQAILDEVEALRHEIRRRPAPAPTGGQVIDGIKADAAKVATDHRSLEEDLEALRASRRRIGDTSYTEALRQVTCDYLGLSGTGRDRFVQALDAMIPEVVAAEKERRKSFEGMHTPEGRAGFAAELRDPLASRLREIEQDRARSRTLEVLLDSENPVHARFLQRLAHWTSRYLGPYP
jgi:hypothetical protein